MWNYHKPKNQHNSTPFASNSTPNFESKVSIWRKKVLIGVELRRINIYTIFYTKNVCLCVFVCVCVCVYAQCVCVMCVSEWVCMCCILLISLINYKKYMWCVLYTHTPQLTLIHSRLHALAHLHVHMHAHAFHTLKEWICVDYNSMQFDAFWVN